MSDHATLPINTAFPASPAAPAVAMPVVAPIPERTATTALGVLCVGGILAQLLFFGQFLGLNVPLWIAFVLGAAFAFRPRGARIDRFDLWLAPAALVFAAFVALRDEGMLLAFDLSAAGALTLASVVALGGNQITRGSARMVARLAAIASVLFAGGTAQLGRGLAPIAYAFRRNGTSTPKRVLRGLIIAFPLLLIFAALFAAADAVYAAYLRRLVALDLGTEFVPRVVLGLVAAWLLGGTIVAAWIARQQPEQVVPASAPHAGRALGAFEVAVALAAIDAMFGLFVLLQAAYLLGGVDTLAVSGMTYSEYARRGFFELIVAAALAGSVIVVMARVVERRDRPFRVLGSLLAILTGVVLLSAVVRLGMYQTAYGWTELRFYTLAAICWLAVGLAATIVLLARDRVDLVSRFVIGAGLVVAVACNLVGPQSFVTQQNVLRVLNPDMVAPGGHSGLDVGYLGLLDADAVRVLAATVDRLPEPERDQVNVVLASDKARLENSVRSGLASWNWARQRALEALIAAGY